jgi:hypothetical protein
MEDQETVTLKLTRATGEDVGSITLRIDQITSIESNPDMRARVITKIGSFFVDDSTKQVQATIYRHLAERLEAEATVDPKTEHRIQ